MANISKMGQEEDNNASGSASHLIPNPFYSKLTVPWYRYPQILFMSLTVVPIRLILIALLNIMAWLVCSGALSGKDILKTTEKPFTGYRKQVRRWAQWMGRCLMRVMGFTCVRIHGTAAVAADAPSIVCAPHSTFFDAAAFFFHKECPSIVAKYETIKYPIFGKLLLITQPVLVKRDETGSREAVKEELKRRANSRGLWNQFIIFPEGTTTNRRALCSFKPGAFIAGKPVQPVTVRFTDKWDTVTWTWSGPSGFVNFWLTLCKWRVGFELNYLPPHVPSQDEIDNPQLFADNVRKEMALALKIPCVDLTFNEARKMAMEKQMPEFLTEEKIKDLNK